MEFDHIAILGETLAQATAHVETILSVPLQQGGTHEKFKTHNDLMGLANGLYVESLSVLPDAPAQDAPRMFGVDSFKGPPRLTNWICRCADIDATLAALPDGFGVPVDVTRGDFNWRMAVPALGTLPYDNCAPALIEWQGDLHPMDRLTQVPVTLNRLTLTHPDADGLAALLAPHLTDTRIHFVKGAPQVSAMFDTPDGPATL